MENNDKMNQVNSIEYPKEFHDVFKVVDMGANKYSPNGWLDPSGKGQSYKENHDSMFHHLSKSYSGERTDPESQLDHYLHLACRALMAYTRLKRGIKYPGE
jgi:hypothetical protein